MRIAIVFNRDSRNVINLFGSPNQEKIGLKTIKRLSDALRNGGHQVKALEADKDLVDRLEEFMPRVVQGERPGMVFNVSYGLQGQARYTHVPSILEMVGVPYVASGPLGHSLALDKVVTKMILRQHDIPTPEFLVLDSPDAPVPEDLPYPFIVKPKSEAVSFGLKIVNNEAELREGVKVIFGKYKQAVLAERFIEGREVNVGLLGNNPPEAFPPVELTFGSHGPAIYTYEDKTGRSGRTILPVCPAPLGDELTEQAKNIAIRAFTALGLYDCARVDMRLDDEGKLYVLEVNSLPSLGEHGSYLVGADHVGLDFGKFVNRLVDVASARYFGTPEPPVLDAGSTDTHAHTVAFVTQRREQMERRLKRWVDLSSRTDDVLGLRQAVKRSADLFEDLAMKPVSDLTDAPEVCTWQTRKGLEGGTLFVANLDVPLEEATLSQHFRREPERLFGEGVGYRAALVSLEYALRSLRSVRKLSRLPVGVLLYTDEGRGAPHSAELIRAAAARAKRVIVLQPGAADNGVILRRRGNRRFSLRVLGKPIMPARTDPKQATLRWTIGKLERIAQLTTQKGGVSVSILSISSERHAMHLPHRVAASLVMTYLDEKAAEQTERSMREILGKQGLKWDLDVEWDRPPMKDRQINARLFRVLQAAAQGHGIELKRDTSTWASVAGAVGSRIGCVCGVGPATRDRGTPSESVDRISLVERTLILTEFLTQQLEDD